MGKCHRAAAIPQLVMKPSPAHHCLKPTTGCMLQSQPHPSAGPRALTSPPLGSIAPCCPRCTSSGAWCLSAPWVLPWRACSLCLECSLPMSLWDCLSSFQVSAEKASPWRPPLTSSPSLTVTSSYFIFFVGLTTPWNLKLFAWLLSGACWNESFLNSLISSEPGTSQALGQ